MFDLFKLTDAVEQAGPLIADLPKQFALWGQFLSHLTRSTDALHQKMDASHTKLDALMQAGGLIALPEPLVIETMANAANDPRNQEAVNE